jgi:hypothetical protein
LIFFLSVHYSRLKDLDWPALLSRPARGTSTTGRVLCTCDVVGHFCLLKSGPTKCLTKSFSLHFSSNKQRGIHAACCSWDCGSPQGLRKQSWKGWKCRGRATGYIFHISDMSGMKAIKMHLSCVFRAASSICCSWDCGSPRVYARSQCVPSEPTDGSSIRYKAVLIDFVLRALHSLLDK